MNISLCFKRMLVLYTINLKDLENILHKDLFIRCHSGFIINTDYITAYKKSLVYLCNKFVVPVSKANTSKILNFLLLV